VGSKFTEIICIDCQRIIKVQNYRLLSHTGRCRSCHAKYNAPKAGRARGDQKRLRPYEHAYNSLRREATRSQRSITLTYEQYVLLISNLTCTYCQDVLPLDMYSTNSKAYCVDRKDSSMDYTVDNVVPCCFMCNSSKSNLFTHDEFLLIGQKIRDIKIMRGTYKGV
jgi:5-methylcytosine-specific restriction endonuclease McrA